MTATTPRTTTLLRAVVLGAVVVCVAVLGWQLGGGRWFVVSTPSMGEAAPRGSVLLTRPSTVASTVTGEIVTFRNPSDLSDTVFSHRVTAVTGQGLLTRGDANGADDAWVVTDDDLVGVVVGVVPGVGHLLRALPLLVLGCLVVWGATRRLAPPRRAPLRLAGTSALVGLVSWWLRPWVGLDQLGQSAAPGDGGGVVMQVISTGLLPVRVSERGDAGETAESLSNGQQTDLLLLTPDDRGTLGVVAALDLPWWGWGVLAAVCLAPSVVGVAVSRRPGAPHAGPEQDAEDPDGPEGPPGPQEPAAWWEEVAAP